MKYKNLILASILVSNVAFAGGQKGNGGGAIVCKDPLNPSIQTIEMYDLFEGKSRYKFSPDYISGGNVEEYVENALARLREKMPSLAAKVKASLKLVEGKIERTNDELEMTLDASKTRRPVGCEYVQVAIWDERTDRIDLNTKWFDQMSPRDQAALYIHEAVYFVARKLSEATNSDDTRELVARVFLNQEIKTSIAKEFQTHGVQKMDYYPMAGFQIHHEYYDKEIHPLVVSWSESACYQLDTPKTGVESLKVKLKLNDVRLVDRNSNKSAHSLSNKRNHKQPKLYVGHFSESKYVLSYDEVSVGETITVRDIRSVHLLAQTKKFATMILDVELYVQSEGCDEMITKKLSFRSDSPYEFLAFLTFNVDDYLIHPATSKR